MRSLVSDWLSPVEFAVKILNDGAVLKSRRVVEMLVLFPGWLLVDGCSRSGSGIRI